MKPDWETTVKWANGEGVKQLVVAASQPAAKRAARKLAIAQRPYNGSPLSVEAVLPRKRA